MSEQAKDHTARVRFAPSPTGHLHVGGARTAIFNWLYARHGGGRFILRIEDTDVERSTKASEEALLEDLRWLGLDWDEGPDTGGDYAPYRQSERVASYRAKADEMMARGLAYACFCSEEELERKRRMMLDAGDPVVYDGTCRSLVKAEVETKTKAGVPFTIRFRLPDEDVRFDDSIRGDITLPAAMVGDFILIRSNGLPTYNYAAALDDCAMRITHVLRGEEHLPNTLRQMVIYRALGAEPPQFGHFPLIVGEDRAKLSKRHGASSVSQLRQSGYLPQAVVNYLALLGWSHSEEKEFMPVDELIADFSLGRVGKSASVFDMKKLQWMNGMHIRSLAASELFSTADAYFPNAIKEAYGEEKRRRILELIQKNLETLANIPAHSVFFMPDLRYEPEASEVLSTADARKVLDAFAAELDRCPDKLDADAVKQAVKAAGKAGGAKGKDLYFPIRAAVTGATHGPDLVELMIIKEKPVVMALVDKARAFPSK